MNPAELERRIRLGEDSRTEFKSVVRTGFKVNGADFAKAVVCFANSGGGQIFVGVDDDGTPSGIGDAQQADALLRQLSQICQTGVHPPLTCSLVKTEVSGVAILLVDVPGFAPGRPYRAGNVHYLRDANRCREANRDELVRLLESADYHFDEQSVSGASLQDLDPTTVGRFVGAIYVGVSEADAAPYLHALKCIDSDSVPTVAGILLFGREPQRWLPDSRITAVRVPGIEPRLEFADRQEIGGPLSEQIAGARVFLDTHVPSPSRVEGWERVPLGIPERILREAVMNAVSHRDYRATSQTRILVFDDRVEIVNPGGLLNRLTVDSIRIGGISQRRNPVIASLLAREAQRENVGFGVPEMFRLMREGGHPEPQIDLAGGHFRVVLRVAGRGRG